MKQALLIIAFSFSSLWVAAQNYLYPVDSIYLSGAVYDADSVNTLPSAHILINRKPIGVTNELGQFLIYISRKDTLTISYLGFQEYQYVFPEKTFRDEYFMRIPLRRDSILLKEIEIYPWPKKGAFRQAFLEAKNIPNADKKVIIPGAMQYDGPVVEPEPTVANPASLLQKAFGKEGRRDRKLKKYKKQVEEEYYEFQR
jgi:hypothetical protein